QSSLEFRRALSTTSYTNFQVSRYFFAQRQDVLGKLWPNYVEPEDSALFARGDPRRTDYFLDSGDDDTWQDRRTTTWGLQWSIVQRFRRHELELGVDHEFQTVQYVTIQNPWIFDKDGLGESHDLWQVHPWTGD